MNRRFPTHKFDVTSERINAKNSPSQRSGLSTLSPSYQRCSLHNAGSPWLDPRILQVVRDAKLFVPLDTGHV